MTTLRQVTAADADDPDFLTAWVDVFRDARLDRLRFLLDLHSAEEDRWFLRQVVLPQNQIWIAEAEGRPVGFVAFAPGWLNHLYVAAAWQSRGIGRRLLDVAKRANTELSLWAFEENAAALRFYAREGFVEVARTDGQENEARRPDVRLHWRSA